MTTPPSPQKNNPIPPPQYGSPFKTGYKKPIAIALEIILGSALISGGIYLAYMHGIGTIGLIGIGAGGTVAMAISITATCLHNRKTPSPQAKVIPKKQSKAVIKGKIAIVNYLTAGPLGKDPTHLFPITREVQRIDGQDWTQNPNEMLVEFEIFGLENPIQLLRKNPPLSEKKTLYLPICLKKEDENIIEFDCDDYRYCLTIAQEENKLNMTFKQAMNLCNTYARRTSILPQEETRNPPTSSDQMKHKFYTSFQIPSNFQLTSPIRPRVDQMTHEDGVCKLVLELPGVAFCDIKYFYSETSFAVYCQNKKMVERHNQLPLKEYLFIRDYDENLTKEMIEEATIKTSDVGILTIICSKK